MVRVSMAAKDVSLGIEKQNRTEQTKTPWYNPAWNYRRSVIITNNGTPSNYYQVLIKLSPNNFDFTRAKPDGSDVRLTGSDGTTELSYWIESWKSSAPQEAYIWVRIFPLMSGENTIYLYYDNILTVESHSDGTKTFDGFDDKWSQFTGGGYYPVEESQLPSEPNGINSTFVWIPVGGIPTASGSILSLPPGIGITSNPSYQYHAVGFRANFGLGNGGEWGGFINGTVGQQTIIGDLLHDVNIVDMYLINYAGSSIITSILNGDWHNSFHTYEIRWRAGLSEGDLDHGASTASSTSQVPTIPLPITLYSSLNSNATLKVDWVYERQYRIPEPTVNVSTEQGLVDLGINIVDSPDPLRVNADLSYLITITNNNSADASGVVVTDTLPVSVEFVKANSSSECNQAGSDIICRLNTINANSTASVTIGTYPTINGVLTNNAEVSSLGYELDERNNKAQAMTMVDSIKPVVIWEQPVGNRQTYVSYDDEITLEVSATDNDQIAKVEFWWYDVTEHDWNRIGTATIPTPPFSSKYLITFFSNILVTNNDNPVEVYVFDRAGNENDLSEANRQVIFINRISFHRLYLPLIKK